MKKVLISCPIGGQKQYSINNYFNWIANQKYKNYDVCISSNGDYLEELDNNLKQVQIKDIHGQTKKIISLPLTHSEELSVIQKITYSREKIRRYAIKNNYDYIFYLDSDTIPLNSNSIMELINLKLDVVSGLYFYKGTSQPVVIDKDTHTNISHKKIEDLYNNKKYCEVWGFGFGCLLLSKKAFSEVGFDYDIFGEERTDDFGYCHALEQKGFIKYFYPQVICRHLEDTTKKKSFDIDKFKIPIIRNQSKNINNKKPLINNEKNNFKKFNER